MNVFGRDLRQPKGFRAGTHRARSPAETLAAYWPLAAGMGITRLANITGLDDIGLPVYVCVRPNARSLATSQGKGIDVDAAKASALMESVEAWHAERIALPARHDSARSLARSSRIVDITALPVFRGAVVRDDAPLWWVEGWDLARGTPAWVPYEAVTLNFVSVDQRATFAMSSNGLSSGNHPLEALCHGLLEVIERDADAAWALLGDEAALDTAVDLDSIDDPLCRHVLDLIDRAGLRATVFDVTSDVGVPAYRCSIHQAHEAWRTIGPAGGAGCHLAPEIALLRALTEAVQSRVTLIAGSRDDMFHRSYARFTSARASGAFADVAARASGRRSLRDRASLATDTFEGDLEALLASLERVGVTGVVAVDLGRPEIGIPVVKVVVPGMNQTVTEAFELPRWRHHRERR